MGMTDPIADMLTRIRNANRMHFKTVDILSSKMNANIAEVLKKAGFITGYELKKDKYDRENLRIELVYPDSRNFVLTDIQRVSKPGRRVYVHSQDIPKVLNGYGIAILSTSRGIMTDQEARDSKVGGEILCKVW
ncbi:MAG TPA: 30S ribosomal protein S8 [Syntrophus sp. (in: bacteria)]|jgi:small subunit ribosomal protein S8|nr:30S ribosomal protein S8 [Syntrophus sp. (in: bacteria)]